MMFPPIFEQVKLIAPEKKKITVVIPIYNERETIGKIVSLSKKICPNILIVIAKKSDPKTIDGVKKLGVPFIIDSGKGKGAALRMAIETVKTQIIVFIDGDGSHDPKDIPRLVIQILNGKADMVIASRMTGGSDELHGTFDRFLRLV